MAQAIPPNPPVTPPVAPTHQQPSNPDQIHYQNLISFFKWAIGIGSAAITAVIGFGLYFSYRDANDMKTEYFRLTDELRTQISDIKNEAKTAKNIQEDAKEKVSQTQLFSEREIGRIQTSTSEIALRETQKNIDAIFKTNQIQDLIQNEAVKEVEDNVSELVSRQLKNIPQITAAASNMISGNIDGLEKLKSYFLNPESKEDSLMAVTLYENICKDYEARIRKKYKPLFNLNPSSKRSLDSAMAAGTLPTDISARQLIEGMIKRMNEGYLFGTSVTDLDSRAYAILVLSEATGQDFKCFEFEKVNRWFDGLKK